MILWERDPLALHVAEVTDRHVCTGLASHYGFTLMGATHFGLVQLFLNRIGLKVLIWGGIISSQACRGLNPGQSIPPPLTGMNEYRLHGLVGVENSGGLGWDGFNSS
jgi:hypothetical protein